jgi:hypothetical protein
MIDLDTYFEKIRPSMFAGAMNQQQVDGQCVLVQLWNYQATGTPMTDLRWLAYLLATVYHECATKMWPVTEYGTQEYLQSLEYYPYIGRGFVQLTWKENYERASAILGLIDDRDLVDNPDVALDSLIAARCLFRGCAEGWWTGEKLGDYCNDKDDLIAGYHKKFLDALTAAETERPETRLS